MSEMNVLESRLPIRRLRNYFQLITVISLGVAIAGCSAPEQIADVTESPDAANLPTVPAITADATRPNQFAILIAGPGADAELASDVEVMLSEIGAQRGLTVERRETLARENMPEGLRLVVALAPDPGIVEMAGAAPQVQFVAVGITGIEAGGNLTVVGGEGGKPEYVGFMAGYTAAIITEDWRVGILAISDTVDGQLVRESFLTGVRYFCGLCLQAYPPFVAYPLFVELPVGASAEQWQDAANQLLNSSVRTIYIAPDVGDTTLLEYLGQAGVAIIGSTAPAEEYQQFWVATIQVDYLALLRETLESVLAGQGGSSIALSPEFRNVNPELLSVGKLSHVEGILKELLAGYILPTSP